MNQLLTKSNLLTALALCLGAFALGYGVTWTIEVH